MILSNSSRKVFFLFCKICFAIILSLHCKQYWNFVPGSTYEFWTGGIQDEGFSWGGAPIPEGCSLLTDEKMAEKLCVTFMLDEHPELGEMFSLQEQTFKLEKKDLVHPSIASSANRFEIFWCL